MPFSVGTTVGHYEILAPLGAGGMGEVYRARDSKLKRDVALKVLPDSVANDKERMTRFQREAEILASLNHPNIAAIYGVEDRALVMELVDGENPKGPLALETVLNYASQIAEALEAAHEKGIIHRDLKPANVKVTPGGVVKVLDFGLAKTADESAASPDATNSPTITISPTRAGMILGTAAYMSPEQARGKPVDKRADIWSFGVILYELLTGKRPFQGESVVETLGLVMNKEPDWTDVPVAVQHLLRSCLQKDFKKRLQAIGDAKFLLAEPIRNSPKAQPPRAVWGSWAAVAALAVLAAIGWTRRAPPVVTSVPELAFTIAGPSDNLSLVGGLNVERISPDGSTVLYRAAGRFHIRRLSSLQDQPLPPFDYTGDAFWAPDSKSIAFPTVTGLMKMQVPNGAPELITADVLADRGAGRGGSWSDKGIILFASLDSSPGGIGLYGVPAAGGKAYPVEVPGLKDGRYFNPEFLPGGEDFLFAFVPSDAVEAQLFMATLRDGKAVDPQLLFSNDTAAAFTSAGGGRILFVRNDNLYAQKLDVKARHIIGEPELIQERVASNAASRSAYFSVSGSGTIVWRSGTAVVSQVTVFDRKGNRIGTAGASVPAEMISLAPDEAHVLVTSRAGSWVMESNGPGRVRLGSPVANLWSLVWSPDGSGIIGVRGGEIVERSVSGSRESRPFAGLPAFGGRLLLHDISVDGRRILYSGTSLLSFSLDGDRRSEQVVEQRVDNAGMSPDGAWAVYHPYTESGIYVQPLTSHGLRKQIAKSGNSAVWRKDGKEIVYSDQPGIWSVPVGGLGTDLRFAAPAPLFSVSRPFGLTSASRPLAISRDGSRIYFLQSAEEPNAEVLHVRTGAIR